MIRTSFHSHSEQVALLGSAAVIDPTKYPRRYDQLIARTRFQRGMVGVVRDDAFLRRKALADRAKLYTDLSMSDAAREIGCTIHTLKAIAKEFDISFRPQHQRDERDLAEIDTRGMNEREITKAVAALRRKRLDEQASKLTHLTMREAGNLLGITYDAMRKIAARAGLKFKPACTGRPCERLA